MDNREQYNGPRRLDPNGRNTGDRYDRYESDSGALSSGTGRSAYHRNGHQHKDELDEPISEYFEDGEAQEPYYYEDEPYEDRYLQEDEGGYRDYYEGSSGEYEDAANNGFNPNKATREPYSGIEPLDDDLVNYDEFGRQRKQKRIKEEKLVTRSRVIWGWIISIAVAVAIAFVVRAFFFEIIVVEGDSMQPTLATNEKLAVEKVSRYMGLPEKGDIIIVHYPNMEGTYVKRVIALPGESVEVKDSTVYVNGQPLSEPYINPEPYMDMSPIVVPADTVFVMGDNRAHSLDSRTSYIGPISHSEIVGHAMAVIWPPDNFHTVE